MSERGASRKRPARRGVRTPAVSFAAAMALGAGALAQPAADGSPEGGAGLDLGNKDDAWTLRLELMAWYPAPGGDVELPGLEFDHETVRISSLNLDSPRLSPLAELTVSSGDWRLAASGFVFSVEGREGRSDEGGELDGVAFGEGTTLTSSLDFASWQVGARYEFFEWPRAANEGGDWPFVLSAEAVGGVRFYSVDLEVAGAGARVSHDEFFGDPYVGLRVVMDVADRLTLDVETNLGYFSSGDRETLSSDITVGFMYRPTDNLGVQIGYRQLAFNLGSGEGEDEFEFGSSLAGVYAGAVLRF